MISRPNKSRNFQGLAEKQQGLNRSVGNIINLNEKLSRSPIAKLSALQRNDKSQYLQNNNSKLNSNERNQNRQNKDDNRPTITPYEIQEHLIHNQNNGHIQKKDCSNRNRQFVIKVQNINKIHDQINTMLSYVKNGQSKSMCKVKQIIPQQRNILLQKQTQNGNKMRINNYMQQNFKQNKNQIKLQYQIPENLIMPTTLQHKQGINQILKKEKLKNQQLILLQKQKNLSPLKRNLNLEINPYYKRNSNNQDSLNRQSSRSSNSQIQFERKSLYNKKQIQNRPFLKNTTAQQNPQKANKQDKPAYSYNYDNTNTNTETDIDMPVSKFVQKSALQKNQKGKIDYDYEILKVKERIQYSELMTKKMQEKLASHNKQKSYPSNTTKTINKNYIPMSHQRPKVNKTIEFTKQKQTGLTQYKANQQRIEKTTKNHNDNFQLKIFPCSNDPKQSKLKIYGDIKKEEANKIIAQKLAEQIKLDQKLRDARELFNNSCLQNKWKLLKQKLWKQGYSYTEQQLQKQLTILPNQSNPFTVQSQLDRNQVQNLAEAFINSQQFWQSKLGKFISRNSLQKCQFNSKQLDLDSRGYLIIQDLVCFVNLHTTNFFRNRDAVCLFKRMVAMGRNKNGVDYQNFMNIITYQ